MMDLDGLKAINDRYGHFHGDQVLRAVSGVIKIGVRRIDTAARYGGDEFVCSSPETEPTGAYVLAEKIRQGVEELTVAGAGVRHPHVDIHRRGGLPGRRPTADDLLISADRAMYVSKRQGKNRVVGYTPAGVMGPSDDDELWARRVRGSIRAWATPPDLAPARLFNARHPCRDDAAGRRPAPEFGADLPGGDLLLGATRTNWRHRLPATAPATPTRVSTTRPAPPWRTRSPSSRAPMPRTSSRPAWRQSTPRCSRSSRLVTASSARRTSTGPPARSSRRCSDASALRTDFVDATDLDAVRGALAATPTRVLYLETISNPDDLRAGHRRLSGVAHRHGAWSSWTTRLRRRTCAGRSSSAPTSSSSRPRSTCRATAMCWREIVAGSRERIAAVREVQVETGATLAPFSSFLVLRGLPTLEIRMRRHADTALRLASLLEGQRWSRASLVSGPPSHPQRDAAARQFLVGGGMFAMELAGGPDGDGRAAATAFIDALTIPVLTASLGSIHTIVVHPPRTTHRQLDDAELAASGIAPGLLRVSVGLEDADDLEADFRTALHRRDSGRRIRRRGRPRPCSGRRWVPVGRTAW